MTRTFSYIISICIFTFLIFNILNASDERSDHSYKSAQREFNKGNYKLAAQEFKAAELYADSYNLKAKALKKAALSYRKADIKFQEFECLTKLIENYPDQVNFNETVEREYEIGNSYYDGYREHPFSWFPWIENDNKTEQIYNKILKQSPYAKFIPTMLLKLGVYYLNNDKNQAAINIYRKVINQYGNSKVTYIAYVELANIYLQLSKTGDGDGSNAKAARQLLKDFIEKYPKSKEIPWAKNALEETYQYQADDLLKLAEYYDSLGNTNASKRYIREILINYPETSSVRGAEILLNKIELPMFPRKVPLETKKETKYAEYQFQDSPADVLVIPQNSSGKWLNPIEDIGLKRNKFLEKEFKNKI
ncbi:MAG: tetratricopeptide repeat protein [bacterium]|nr:tetratricopeptide repeat protein [bacterium]